MKAYSVLSKYTKATKLYDRDDSAQPNLFNNKKMMIILRSHLKASIGEM